MNLNCQKIFLAVLIQIWGYIIICSVEGILAVADLIAVYIDIVGRLNAAEGDINSPAGAYPVLVNIKFAAIEADGVSFSRDYGRKHPFVAVCAVVPRVDGVGVDRKVKALSLP